MKFFVREVEMIRGGSRILMTVWRSRKISGGSRWGLSAKGVGEWCFNSTSPGRHGPRAARNNQSDCTFASGAHGEHEGNEQVEQHPLAPLLIGERRDHMAEREVLLQGLGTGNKKIGTIRAAGERASGGERAGAGGADADLDLQGHQSHHRGAEGQRRGEVGAEVEERKPVRHAGGTDHAHHLEKHRESLKKIKNIARNDPGRSRGVPVPG